MRKITRCIFDAAVLAGCIYAFCVTDGYRAVISFLMAATIVIFDAVSLFAWLAARNTDPPPPRPVPKWTVPNPAVPKRRKKRKSGPMMIKPGLWSWNGFLFVHTFYDCPRYPKKGRPHKVEVDYWRVFRKGEFGVSKRAKPYYIGRTLHQCLRFLAS